MSKEYLVQVFSNVPAKNYTWNLYFFKIDRRARNPYKVHKVRFKQAQYLIDYSHHLSNVVSSLQIGKIDQVQNYDGMNTKISCDKIGLDNELLSENWGYFNSSVAQASDEELARKVNGYIVVGQPPADSEHPPLVMVKVANPVMELSNNRSIAYKNTEDAELDLITDTIYRLYLTVDFFVCDGQLYAFNHNFERVFDIEKTMKKVKETASERILSTGCTSDTDALQGFIAQYKSPRTFITLNESRIEKVAQREGREHIASILQIPLDSAGLLAVTDMEKASLLIKYLCYKLFQESETEDILEANTITKLQLAP